MMPLIEVQHLTKVFGQTLAVDDVSFALPGGRVCGLVGCNGAGKTTTMRCLAGLLPPTGGTIRIDGMDPAVDETAVKQRIAYVPDDPPLFDDLSTRDHLHFIGRLYGVEDYLAATEHWLERFQLESKARAGATTLSRGMRQKLAIACAAIFDPPVWLLDEPLTGLDPPGIRMVLDLIESLAVRGRSVILSSHLLSIIEPVCTDVLVMDHGQVKHFGPAQSQHQPVAVSQLESTYFGGNFVDA